MKTFIFLLCSLSTISKNTVNENFRIKELVVPKFAQVGLCTAKHRKLLSFNVLTLFEFGLTLFRYGYSDSEQNHAANKGKMTGRYQFDTHPTGIGLNNSEMFLRAFVI